MYMYLKMYKCEGVSMCVSVYVGGKLFRRSLCVRVCSQFVGKCVMMCFDADMYAFRNMSIYMFVCVCVRERESECESV